MGDYCENTPLPRSFASLQDDNRFFILDGDADRRDGRLLRISGELAPTGNSQAGTPVPRVEKARFLDSRSRVERGSRDKLRGNAKKNILT
jgi:hypothetical protein